MANERTFYVTYKRTAFGVYVRNIERFKSQLKPLMNPQLELKLVNLIAEASLLAREALLSDSDDVVVEGKYLSRAEIASPHFVQVEAAFVHARSVPSASIEPYELMQSSHYQPDHFEESIQDQLFAEAKEELDAQDYEKAMRAQPRRKVDPKKIRRRAIFESVHVL